MATTSINSLPTVDEITSGDFLIVEKPTQTGKINFDNFIIGLDNTTFRNTIENNTTNINSLSTDVIALSSNLSGVPAALGYTVFNSNNITTLSADIRSLSATFYEASLGDATVANGDTLKYIPITIAGTSYAILLSALPV